MLTARKSMGPQSLGFAIGSAKKAKHAYVTLSLEQAQSVRDHIAELEQFRRETLKADKKAASK